MQATNHSTILSDTRRVNEIYWTQNESCNSFVLHLLSNFQQFELSDGNYQLYEISKELIYVYEYVGYW